MKDIHIPPAALEAGARAIIALRVDADVWPHLSDLSKHQYMEQVRAAFEAMVAAWPGAEQLGESSIMISGAEVDIPARINLPQEVSDE